MKFRLPLDTLASSFQALGDFPFESIKMGRFERPALFVRAMQSHYINEEAITLIQKFFPRSEMADIDCGHWVVTERPAEFRYRKL